MFGLTSKHIYFIFLLHYNIIVLVVSNLPKEDCQLTLLVTEPVLGLRLVQEMTVTTIPLLAPFIIVSDCSLFDTLRGLSFS